VCRLQLAKPPGREKLGDCWQEGRLKPDLGKDHLPLLAVVVVGPMMWFVLEVPLEMGYSLG
jgi:hypothetical protein